MSPGPLEIGIVLLIILVIFGPKRLPELGKSLGSGMKSFKDSVTGGDDDSDKQISKTQATTESAAREKSESAAGSQSS